MLPLPIDPHIPLIRTLLGKHGALVLLGPPGCGKTTRVPPALLEGGLLSEGRVLLLQPRRIAARAAAARIAEERGWTLGREAGYTVRFENRAGPRTRVHVITEGILARMLQEDPFLGGVSAVILDEFHERSIHTDLALALLEEIRGAGRGDLLLLVMSATLDPAPVASYLGGAPVLEVEGRPHPVTIRYSEGGGLGGTEDLPRRAAEALRGAWAESEGDALVFLPGIGEIRRTFRELEDFTRSRDAALLPLHGGLSLEEQQLALRPAPRRKIILSTNIAETSLTIEGVDLVIDGGLARILRHSQRHGIDRLETVRISRHSADQRAGRAGRVRPGLAVRLWSQREHATLPEAETPEIRRVDLAATVLELRAWGVADPSRFAWFEAPETAALERAEDLLLSLGAVERKGGAMTPVGKGMLRIPAHPRISRMLVAANEARVLPEAAILAALIEERDILPVSLERRGRGFGPPRSGPSDLLARKDLFEEAEREGFRRGPEGLDLAAARMVARTRDVILRAAREALAREHRAESPRRLGGEECLLRVLLCAYPDRVARRRAKGSDRARMVGGRGVVLSAASIVRDDPFFLAIDLDDGAAAEARVDLASAVERSWIEEDLAPLVREVVETRFDEEAAKVRSTAALSYRDLPLEEPRERRPPPEEAERLLAEAVRVRAEGIFAASDSAAGWLARVRFLAAHLPELGLPAFDSARLGEILASSCAERTSVAQVAASDLLGLLRSTLSRGQIEALEIQAPESLRVPSGSRIRLRYEGGRPPVLAVRLQEMFGLAETPRVAAGRVPVLLHLLGPNYRPVQITQDLRSFWERTYAQVRKDLRARYPKHAWPEDPWSATPDAPGRRRKSP